jgi:hypothetical protein
MRPVAVVEGVKSVGDVVLTTSLRAHGPSSCVGVDPQPGPVSWEDLLGRTACMGDALGAPAMEAVGIAASAALLMVTNIRKIKDGNTEKSLGWEKKRRSMSDNTSKI